MTEMVTVTVAARGFSGSTADLVEMELPAGSTVAVVLDYVLAAKGGPGPDTDPKVSHNVIATVNGRFVPFSEFGKAVLTAGDQVTVMPLIVGG
jgi:sulfur carrier protein ThiS